MSELGWGALRDDLEADVRRVTDRLRSLSLARLAGPVPPHASRADAARAVAQLMAEVAQGLADRHAAREPSWRELPVLSDLAVGEQVAVTGHDLLGELATIRPTESVWSRGSRRTAREVVAAAAAALAETRRRL
ncbi:MAG: hypothetical protein ACRDWY_00710 [Actinomycetes bacterium]